jgi:hypothetical protein
VYVAPPSLAGIRNPQQKLSSRTSALLTRTRHSTAWTYVEIAHARVESIWDGIGDEAA